MGWVTASWPASCVLLSFGEVPSVFVDLNSGKVAIFDQIEATFDAKSHSLHLFNPTAYPAKVRIQKSQGEQLNVVVVAGQRNLVSTS